MTILMLILTVFIIVYVVFSENKIIELQMENAKLQTEIKLYKEIDF